MTEGDRDPLHGLPLGSPAWLAELRRRYPRAYAHWTEQEERRLIDAFHAGQSADEIAAVHGRTPDSITLRLTFVGLMYEPTAGRTNHERAPAVMCDGCDVALDDYDVFCLWRNAGDESADYLELCAACLCSAMRRRTSGPAA